MGRYEEHVKMITNPLYWVLNGMAGAILFLIILPFMIYTGNNKPECTLHNFYAPSLNKFNTITTTTTNTTTSTSSNIFFNLWLKNPHDQKGIHYDDVNITFSIDTNPSTVLGSYQVRKFYQGTGKTAKVRKVVVVLANDSLWQMFNTNTTKIRIDLITRVKFKYLSCFYSHKKTLAVGRSFGVDDSGKKVDKNPIQLKSGAAVLSRIGLVFHVAVSVFTFSFFMLT